jgi:hypothetical protein
VPVPRQHKRRRKCIKKTQNKKGSRGCSLASSKMQYAQTEKYVIPFEKDKGCNHMSNKQLIILWKGEVIVVECGLEG